MAECEANESKWATQNRFNTTSTGIGAVDVSDVSIFVNNRMLNVINQSHSYIRSIQIFTVSGQMIKYIEVNASDNVFAFLGNISEQVLMVRVVGENSSRTVKISM